MDFAKKILNKYGWQEGDGLGKNNDGIAKPVRAHMKFDNMGLGVDRAKEFNDHWWERCFNEAASNVDVQKNVGEVQLNVKDPENGVEITTNSYSVKKLKKAKQAVGDEKVKYGNFIYAASLTNSGDTIENPFKVSLDDIAVAPVKVLTDEELFKACGGRTAHKGARHGLKLSGKLARLEQQEAELLAQMRNTSTIVQQCDSSVVKSEGIENTSTKNKKCKKKSKEVNVEQTEENECVRAKTSKKRRISSEPAMALFDNSGKDLEKLNQPEDSTNTIVEECLPKRKKSKKSFEKDEKIVDENVIDDNVESKKKNKKKKKHKQKDDAVECNGTNVDNLNIKDVPRKHKKKNKK